MARTRPVSFLDDFTETGGRDVVQGFSFLIVNSNITNVDCTLGITDKNGKGITVVYGAALRRDGADQTRKNVTTMAGLRLSGFRGRVGSAVVTKSFVDSPMTIRRIIGGNPRNVHSLIS